MLLYCHKMHDFLKRIKTPEIPLLMGIINCTPDSFYPGSRRETALSAVETAAKMVEEGVDIIDIGGESTRPGSRYIDAAEEEKRIVPVVGEIRERFDIPISVDTRKASVARKALQAGADMINDISALEDDPEMMKLVADRDIPVVLMHKQGIPMTMQENPSYTDVVEEIKLYLHSRCEAAVSGGVSRDKIIIDPGIGFGKRLKDNVRLLSSLKEFKDLGYPVLVGASRKGFIGKLLGKNGGSLPVEDRLHGTLSAHMWALMQGADIIRVHDVWPHWEMRAMFLQLSGENGG